MWHYTCIVPKSFPAFYTRRFDRIHFIKWIYFLEMSFYTITSPRKENVVSLKYERQKHHQPLRMLWPQVIILEAHLTEQTKKKGKASNTVFLIKKKGYLQVQEMHLIKIACLQLSWVSIWPIHTYFGKRMFILIFSFIDWITWKSLLIQTQKLSSEVSWVPFTSLRDCLTTIV